MNRIVVALMAVLMTASIVLGAPKPAAKSTEQRLAEAKKAIDKGNAQWIEGWRKGDAAMVASIFAPDGVQLAGSGKIFKGPAEIRERQKAAMEGADPGVKVTITSVNVWLDGNTAWETGKYKYEYTEKGKPGVDEGRYVTAWKLQKDGSWKLAMDMGVPQDPPK